MIPSVTRIHRPWSLESSRDKLPCVPLFAVAPLVEPQKHMENEKVKFLLITSLTGISVDNGANSVLPFTRQAGTGARLPGCFRRIA